MHLLPGKENKCVFFDRDGIVNQSPGEGYVTRPEDFRIHEEFLDALGVVNRKGYLAVVVTNQRGVALGKMSAATVEAIHDQLLESVRARGLRVDAIYYCPHDNGECDCRKPSPGMLLRAAEELDIDLRRSWMIGDSARDIVAGRRVGCRTVLVGGVASDEKADYELKDLRDLAPFLEHHLR